MRECEAWLRRCWVRRWPCVVDLVRLRWRPGFVGGACGGAGGVGGHGLSWGRKWWSVDEDAKEEVGV